MRRRHNAKTMEKTNKEKDKEEDGDGGGLAACPPARPCSPPVPPASIDSLIHVSFGHPGVSSIQGTLTVDRLHNNDSTTCMLSVCNIPCYVSISELSAFFSLSASIACLTNALILNTKENATHHQYTCLLNFASTQAAQTFYADLHGQPFNSLEPELCDILFISAASFAADSRFTFPPSFTQEKDKEGENNSNNNNNEKPCCPVCLDALESVTPQALVTILCNHTFHLDCLSSWRDLKCPVCRYQMKPLLSSHCEECGTGCTDDLWMCLICAHMGCSRYSLGHAAAHYADSGHAYAIDIASQRVWDYFNDAFVHRLIADKTDGQIVEVPSARAAAALHGGYDFTSIKLEDLLLEYNYLLSSQLDKQRLFFQQESDDAKNKFDAERKSDEQRVADLRQETRRLNERATEAARQRAEAEERRAALAQQIERLEKEKEKLDKLNAANAGKQRAVRDGLEEQRQRAALTEAASVREKDRLIKEAEETLSDLRAHLRMVRKVAKAPSAMKEELKTADTTTVIATHTGKTKKKR